ncbi:hypothetical protein, partial [Gordonia sp. 852002-51296_SCH5728562-b]
AARSTDDHNKELALELPGPVIGDLPFRLAGLSGLTLSGFGHIVDLAARVIGPELLALAVLAICNRTKR